VKAAIGAREAIHQAIADAPFAFSDVRHEVDELVAVMEADAVRAQRIWQFLAGQESATSLERRIAAEENAPVRAALESKQRAFTRLRDRLSGLMGEIDQVVATLQTVQAEILAADELEEQALAGQVSELRDRVQLVAAGLEEAYAETRAGPR
jgi:predicted nuclease with TOPRIM domain